MHVVGKNGVYWWMGKNVDGGRKGRENEIENERRVACLRV